ncbi:MAG: radical SAM protein [Deltaproteobacteria bacterium]|nr:MAG: radical SAM protein [Deltaproteobacteria bacterium]
MDYPDLSGQNTDDSSRLRALYRLTRTCEICPRLCGAKRLQGQTGICRALKFPEVSSHNLHFGEEPPISGTRGSGTIFFTHCNLRCVFCQNYPISHLGHGKPVTVKGLSEMMLALQSRGAHNINLVTPTHYTAQIAHAITLARHEGLNIPIVYNTSGYERTETLRLLEGIVDIYMPDIKFATPETGRRYARAPDYFEVTRKAIREMHRQVGNLILNGEGIAQRGLLIRHLVLPGHVKETREILRFIAEEISPHTYLSLMSQYFPAYRAAEFADLSRRLSREEYETARGYLREFHLDFGWIQEMN